MDDGSFVYKILEKFADIVFRTYENEAYPEEIEPVAKHRFVATNHVQKNINSMSICSEM